MIENEGYKNRIIAVEVAFKGVIELCKAGIIKQDKIGTLTNTYFEIILRIADAKVDDNKVNYLYSLLQNSTYDHDRRHEMEKDFKFGNMTYEEYYRIKEDLLMNQLTIKESGRLRTAKEINKQIGKDIANSKK